MERKKKICTCGCGQEGYYWIRGFLKGHSPKEKGGRVSFKKTISPKRVEKINEDKNYYRQAIARNIVANKGKCLCDECGDEISNAKGSNVSHIISKGANPVLYHDMDNHFILCNNLKDKGKCEQLFSDEGKRSTMKIYPIFLERKEMLNRKYYSK